MDWLRHRLGWQCRRPVFHHGFVQLTWTMPWPEPDSCGWLAHPQAGRCALPERCHQPAEPCYRAAMGFTVHGPGCQHAA